MARRSARARRGVAHLSFPIDVQAKRLADDDKSLGADVQHGTASSWIPQIEVPTPDAVRAAADLLNSGRRTVLLVGQGALGATSEVEAVAERRAAPGTKAFLEQHPPQRQSKAAILCSSPAQRCRGCTTIPSRDRPALSRSTVTQRASVCVSRWMYRLSAMFVVP